MATSKYAVYFPEGPGYLFAERLGQGTFGRVDLVVSVKDRQYYARKKIVASRP